MKTENYDIEGKVSETDVPKLDALSRAERTEMMRAVLADRFRFYKELPVYELVVAKGGYKLKEAAPGDTYPNGLKDDRGKSSPGTLRVGRGTADSQAIEFTSLVEMLTSLAGRPVVDRTGLSGRYDIKLRWSPEDSHPDSDARGPGTEEPIVNFFTAIQGQLGLKLVPAKGPVNILVVDHIEKPSDN